MLIAVERENPFSKSTARIDAQFKVGDSYTYREIDHAAVIIGDGVRSLGDGRLVNGCFPAGLDIRASVWNWPILLKNSISGGAEEIAGPQGLHSTLDAGETQSCIARYQDRSDRPSSDSWRDSVIAIKPGKKLGRVRFRAFQM